MRHYFERLNSNNEWVEITGIKATRYHQQVNKDGVLKFGNVIASSVEVEYYIDSQSDLNTGDAIRYYQIFDKDQRDFTDLASERRHFVSFFFVDSFAKAKKTAKFVAYDIIKKLDVDYSPRLLEIQENFPMTCQSLLNDVASYAGVSISISQWVTGVRDALVNGFYVEGITARTIVGNIAELLGYNCQSAWTLSSDVSTAFVGTYAYSLSRGSISGFRHGASKYIIAPTDQGSYTVGGEAVTPVFYKENGLTISGYADDAVSTIKVIKLDGTEVGSYTGSGSGENTYYVKGNVVAENIDEFANAYALGLLWQAINDISSSSKVSARLFPFRCPFVAGGITWVIDKDDTIRPCPVMNLEWTDSEVLVESYGANIESYEDYDTSNAENQVATIASIVNNLSKDVVTNTSRIEVLEAADVELQDGISTNHSSIGANYYYDSSNYEVGTYVTYGGHLCRCIVDIQSGEVFDPTHWEQVTLLDMVDDLDNKVDTGNTELNQRLAYASGDVESITAYNVPLSGVVTANAATIYMTVFTPKSLENITTITPTSFQGALYGVNGTIESSTTSTEWVGKSGITITCVKLSNNMIRVMLTKSSAFGNATQYTPMGGFIKFAFTLA